MAKLANERSRAYPSICLEEACRALSQITKQLSIDVFSRELLAEALGYSNVYGGPGARKISALLQYGLLERRAGLYNPTRLATTLLHLPEGRDRYHALNQALRRPPLFRALLDQYEPQGRVPVQLAKILIRDHGITQKASTVAAEVFVRSARFADALTPEGLLRIPRDRDSREDPPQGDVGQRFEFLLSNNQVAKLWLPTKLTKADLDVVRRQIDFLEYQVTGGDSDHE